MLITSSCMCMIIFQEREKMLAHFQHLKSQMNKLRDGERDKLTKLTLESNSAIKELKRNIEKVCILSIVGMYIS